MSTGWDVFCEFVLALRQESRSKQQPIAVVDCCISVACLDASWHDTLRFVQNPVLYVAISCPVRVAIADLLVGGEALRCATFLVHHAFVFCTWVLTNTICFPCCCCRAVAGRGVPALRHAGAEPQQGAQEEQPAQPAAQRLPPGLLQQGGPQGHPCCAHRGDQVSVKYIICWGW